METPIKILHPHHNCFICKKEIIDSKKKKNLWKTKTGFTVLAQFHSII
jgi:hypothetical protein